MPAERRATALDIGGNRAGQELIYERQIAGRHPGQIGAHLGRGRVSDIEVGGVAVDADRLAVEEGLSLLALDERQRSELDDEGQALLVPVGLGLDLEGGAAMEVGHADLQARHRELQLAARPDQAMGELDRQIDRRRPLGQGDSQVARQLLVDDADAVQLQVQVGGDGDLLQLRRGELAQVDLLDQHVDKPVELADHGFLTGRHLGVLDQDGRRIDRHGAPRLVVHAALGIDVADDAVGVDPDLAHVLRLHVFQAHADDPYVRRVLLERRGEALDHRELLHLLFRGHLQHPAADVQHDVLAVHLATGDVLGADPPRGEGDLGPLGGDPELVLTVLAGDVGVLYVHAAGPD